MRQNLLNFDKLADIAIETAENLAKKIKIAKLAGKEADMAISEHEKSPFDNNAWTGLRMEKALKISLDTRIDARSARIAFDQAKINLLSELDNMVDSYPHEENPV